VLGGSRRLRVIKFIMPPPRLANCSCDKSLYIQPEPLDGLGYQPSNILLELRIGALSLVESSEWRKSMSDAVHLNNPAELRGSHSIWKALNRNNITKATSAIVLFAGVTEISAIRCG